jgi:hypothetical protein
MEDRLLRFPLVCPECGMELLTELSAAAVVQALVTGDSICEVSPQSVASECHRT